MQHTKKILPLKVNSDLSASYFDEFTARYLKNVTSYESTTNEYGDIKEGNNAASLKKLQSNELYVPFNLPSGNNYCIGAKGFAVTNEVYCFIYNSNGNHSIYRVNATDRTTDLVYQNPCLNFQLQPQYFIASIVLLPIKLTDPDTGITVIKRDLYWADGFNDAGYLRVDDAIGSQGFNSTIFPYFRGNYNPCSLIRMGFETPDKEVLIAEIPATSADAGIPNDILFQGFQFRVLNTNVFGVPSEHGIISDLYFSGVNDCMVSSSGSPRCLSLTFDAGNPLTNSIDVEYRIGNSDQWYKYSTLFLYKGSTIGEWWLRSRNPNVTYNPSTNKITYTFCNNGERTPVAQDETNRVQNPIPKAPQVLFEVNQKLGLANFKQGFSPLSSNILNTCKLSLSTTPVTVTETRTITILVAIVNEVTGNINGVFKNGTQGYVWGDPNEALSYKQYFTNIYQSGFIGYLNDGSVAISEQVYWNGGSYSLDETFANQNIVFQRFTFTGVSAGVKVFRLASHLYDPTSGTDFQSTSTTVRGVYPIDNNYLNIGNYPFLTAPENDYGSGILTKELVIDVSNGNYSTFNDTQMMVIADFAAHSSPLRVISGYVYETSQNGFPQSPMELVRLTNGHGATSVITDHNGFYWFRSQQGGSVAVGFNFYYNCVQVSTTSTLQGHGMTITDITINTKDKAYENMFNLPCNRAIIQGKIILNNSNGEGIPNVPIVLTRGGHTTSNDDGSFSLVCHDDAQNGGVRIDELIISGGACAFTGINGTTISTIPITINACTGGCTERIYDIGTVYLEYKSFKSLLTGGKYAYALIPKDGIRTGFAQPIGVLQVPSIPQSQAINAYQTNLQITNSPTFPLDITECTVAVSKELSLSDYVTWIVDKVDFVDNTGAVNIYSPSQIRIWYASLNKFNANNNYNTTCNWQFIPQGQSNPTVGDKVYFILNGDNTFFSKNISAVVKYDTTGQYFLIDYTSELKGLLANAIIRITRPNVINNTEQISYYEIPNSRIEIKNGQAQTTNILLNHYDTYFLSRQIPVPTLLTTTPLVTTITNTTTTGTIVAAQVQTFDSSNSIVSLKNFGVRFESKSPSNTWGLNIYNQGRPFTSNLYEQVLHKINSVALTGTLSVNGALNYLQYFQESLIQDFDVKNTLGISGAVFDIGVVWFLTQYGNFKVGYNDNLLRVDSSGTVGVASSSSLWGNPEREVGDIYGCQLIDKCSIQTLGKLTMFVDRQQCDVLQYNFSSFKSMISDETEILPNVIKGKIDSSLRAKFKAIASDSSKFFVGGIDPLENKYLLTDFSLNNISYINQSRAYTPLDNNTTTFDINTTNATGDVSFTPEMYASIDGDLLNKQLFTFNNGAIYSHHNINTNSSFNVFYGIQCESVIEIVCATQALSQVFFLALSNYCKQNLLFADRIITQTGQKSYLLLNNFQWGQFFSSAGFLRDTSTLTDSNTTQIVLNNIVQEGNPLYGQWIQIRLITDSSTANNYMEYFGSEVTMFDSKRDPILENGQLRE